MASDPIEAAADRREPSGANEWPSELCDVVMKGGIASGVVYPRAVVALSERYRLKSIGGTSAGAIAAAAAAAAEYGRKRGGFERLARLPEEIGADGKLASLFQAQQPTRDLHRVLMAGMKGGWLRAPRVALSALRGFPMSALLGALPGVTLAALATRELRDEGASPLRVAAAAGAIPLLFPGVPTAVLAQMAWRATRALPANDFGLCSGMPGEGAEGRESLTPWLSDLIDRLAGKATCEPPLTFGDLWTGPRGAVKKGDVDDPWLRLEMMTTNVTNRRGERMPWASHEYYFHPRELARLFPPRIVEHLCAHPPPITGTDHEIAERTLRRLLMEPLRPMPEPANVPVIVATRMSLSFPVLLSAVPLWRVDWSREANAEAKNTWVAWQQEHESDWEQIVADTKQLERLVAMQPPPKAEHCWFSDGGLSSNFPVHFFDAALPRHPTFAINLRPFHPDRPPSTDESRNVWMVPTPGQGISDWWYRLEEPDGRWSLDRRLPGFLTGLVRTMQNRVDEAQMRAPGYRERVAHVSLRADEGGMNLAMTRDVIDRLIERGGYAAELLLRAYADPPTDPGQVSWDAHRWVRYRSASTALAELLCAFDEGYGAPGQGGAQSYAQLRERGRTDPPAAYRINETQRRLMRDLSDGLAALADQLDGSAAILAERSPRPRPAARIVPGDGGTGPG